MRHTIHATLILTVLLLTLAASVPSRCETEIEVTRAADGLYFLTGVVCNVAFLVTDEGVLVVDSGTAPSHGDSIMAAIGRLTDKPVKYLIFTHYHFDHVCGASRFPEDATVVAHENLPGNLKEFNEPRLKELIEEIGPGRVREAEEKLASLDGAGEEELAEAAKVLEKAKADLAETKKIEFVYPDKTFRDAMVINIGGHEVRLIYPGPAHTNGNAIVHFVDLKAVHMGDMLFYMRHPYIDWKAGCDTANWIAALERVAGWDADIVMPGHGELTDKSGLAWMAKYLSELRAEVGEAVEKGESLEEAKGSVKMEQYSDLPWTYMLDAGIEAVYYELTGVER